MRKKKRLYILLGVMAAVCTAAYAAGKYEEHREKIRNSGEVILAVDPDSVTALSWQYEEEDVSFHKDDAWTWDGDAAFPVDETKLLSLLEQFREFEASFTIDDVEDYAQYGLTEPVSTIRITEGEKEYEILLGSYSAIDSERYVSVGDGNVYLVSHDPWEDYQLDASDLIENDVTPLIAEAETIRFSGEENYEVYYEEDSGDTWCADDVYFTDGKPLDTERVSSYLNAVSYLDLSDYVTYSATDEELASCGLADPEITAVITYVPDEDGEEAEGEGGTETFTLHIGRDQEELEEAEKNRKEQEDEESGEEDAVTAYARVGDSPIIYEISSSAYETLSAAGYDDFRHREVITADFDEVRQISITLEGEEYTFTAEGKGDERIWKDADSKEQDLTAVISAMEALSADSFTQEDVRGQEEISFTLYLDNENFPEIAAAFSRLDGSYCLCSVNGQTESKVLRSGVVDLTEAVRTIVLGQQEETESDTGA